MKDTMKFVGNGEPHIALDRDAMAARMSERGYENPRQLYLAMRDAGYPLSLTAIRDMLRDNSNWTRDSLLQVSGFLEVNPLDILVVSGPAPKGEALIRNLHVSNGKIEIDLLPV